MGEAALRIDITETTETTGVREEPTKPATDTRTEPKKEERFVRTADEKTGYVRMTEEEYLAFERASDTKHEYRGGEVVAMSGGTAPHGRIAVSIGGEFRTALRGRKCHVQSSDVRVQIPATEHYVYPDLSVVCGGSEYKDGAKDTLLNPKVVVEVLSPSSEAHDRGEKFAQYRSIPSLMHYVIAAQDKPLLEVYTRQDDGSWNFREYGPGTKAAFAALGCELDVDLVYSDVFDEPAEQATG